MSNVQITNGTIKYGRTIKTGDFESKRGDVELSFNIPEGTDHEAAIAQVHETVKHHIHQILGHNEDTPNRPTIPVKEDRAVKKEPKKLPPAAKEEPKAAVDPSLVAESADETPAFLKKEQAIKAAQAAEGVDEDLDDLLGGVTPAKEITDKELTDAVQKCMTRASNKPAIRKLLETVGVKTPPGRIIDVLQEKRAVFIEKLEEIKPLA